MAFILNHKGERIDTPIDASMYQEAKTAGVSVPQLLNRKFGGGTDITKFGTPFQQMCASEGLIIVPKGASNPYGVRSPLVADILDNKLPISAAAGVGPTNVSQTGTPYGQQSRNLFPAAVIAYIEGQVPVDRVTDTVMFNEMVGQELSVAGDLFEQPIISFDNTNGAQKAKAQRVAQLADVPTMLTLTSTDKPRRLPTYGMGIEMSQQALRSSTLDTLAMTIKRYLEIEKDQRVYNFLSSLFSGDNDMCIGAISAVTSTSLDSAATGGVLTHKAWVKFLARNRKKRKITHAICDVDTYLKVEGRTGRPGLSAYDPRLPTIDPQARAANVSFGTDVRYFLVDAATDGGPVPANTVWALDSAQAVSRVTNTEAAYQATEAFVLRRSEVMVMHWSAEVFRMFGDAELTPFDVLTIS
jgi:hypothetical protein